MAAISDFMSDVETVPCRASRHGASPLKRLSAMVFGVSFILAGVGLWFAPGLSGEPFLLLAKALMTVCMIAAGVAMTQFGAESSNQELHLDPRHQQAYLVEVGDRGKTKVLQVVDFEDVKEIELNDAALWFKDETGATILSMEVEGRAARAEIAARLRTQSLLCV